MEESQRARLFVDGDEDAYATVFREFRGPVFGLALHALADPGLAEEALQLAFLAVWRGRARFDPTRPMAAWVFSIARRAAIDVHRRERRLPATVDVEPEMAADTFSVEQLWEVWEVRRAVEALPAEEADVVRLAHYYQLTHSEIAARLGVPLGTVKSRSFRAHRRLATTLAHLFGGEPAAPADPADPADPVDPADSTDLADPADPADLPDQADQADPVDPADPADPADPVDPADPADPADISARGGPADPGRADPAAPDQSAPGGALTEKARGQR
jgi:RNA polymerase sigma-70 factor (ECF subfamily)